MSDTILPSARYITAAQLAERPGALELAQVACDAHRAIVPAQLMDDTLRGKDRSSWLATAPEAVQEADAACCRIDEAIAQAQATIDGFLAQRGYVLPLERVPPILTGWTRSIARYLLHQHRVGDDARDPIVRDWRDTLRLLELLAAGKFSLGADDAALRGAISGQLASVDVRFVATPPVFGRQQMRGFR